MKIDVAFVCVLDLFVALILVSCKHEAVQPKNVETKKHFIVAEEAVVAEELERVIMYTGKLPSADCPGILITLTLRFANQSGEMENMYELEEEYIGKNTFCTTGEFGMERGYGYDRNAVFYILDHKHSTKEQRYYVSFSDKPEVLHLLNSRKEMFKSNLNYMLRMVR